MADQPREERFVALGGRERHVIVDLTDAFITQKLGREDVGRREVLLLRLRDIAARWRKGQRKETTLVREDGSQIHSGRIEK